MSRPLLPLCEVPKVAIKDGYVGEFAQLYLPFHDTIWFANGNDCVFPGGTIAQDQSRTFSGTRQPVTFIKDCCTCFLNV